MPLPGRSAWTLQLIMLHTRGPWTVSGSRRNRAVQTHGAGDAQGKGEQEGTKWGRQKDVEEGPVACKTGLVSTLVWPSPLPDHCSLVLASYIFLLNVFLKHLSACAHCLSPVNLWCKDWVPATGEPCACARGEFGASSWAQTGGCAPLACGDCYWSQ